MRGCGSVKPDLKARKLIKDMIRMLLLLLLLKLCCSHGVVACSLAGEVDCDAYYTKDDLHGREACKHKCRLS